MTSHSKKATLLLTIIAALIFGAAAPANARDHVEKSKIDIGFKHHEFRLGAAWRPFFC